MNILYLSNASSSKKYDEIFCKNQNYACQQSYKFNKLLAEGFAENNCDITMITGLSVNDKNTSRKIFHYSEDSENNVNYQYLSFLNFKYIRQALIYVNAIKQIKKWMKQKGHGAIVCDVLNYMLLKAAIKCCKNNSRFQLVGIVTDLPEILSSKLSSKEKKHNALIRKCDKFILLTAEMYSKLEIKNKSFIVIEGICNKKMEEVDNTLENKYEKLVVLYSGLLHKKYGIKNLVNGFILANIPNTELHIYGDGDWKNELINIQSKNPNIKYFGIKDNEYVVNEQIKATLLVNPRPINEEFVKYSFPSKNLEYLASGTPMLTTNLPAMPEEYRDYCFVIDGFTEEDIKNSLLKVFANSREYLCEYGLKAKAWVLKNKNNVAQTSRIIKYITESMNE